MVSSGLVDRDKDDGGDMLPSRDAAWGFYQKYEPREVLGKGLSSVVRRAIHKQTGIHYAVKESEQFMLKGKHPHSNSHFDRETIMDFLWHTL